MKRPLLSLAIIAVMVALPRAHLSKVGGADDPAVSESEWRTAQVERGELASIVSSAGTLNAVVLVEVGSQISGQVSELHADFNSSVVQGQVIARIDPDTYEAKLAQAHAELENAQALVDVHAAQIERGRAQVDEARASLAQASAQTVRFEAALDEARREMDRRRPLVERAIVSASEWEKAQSSYRSAHAQLLSARADELSKSAALRGAEAALAMTEAQLGSLTAQVRQREATRRQAQLDLERTYIRAPVTGVIVNRTVNRGQTVAASLQAPTLFSIAQDLTRMQVHASVVEADVGRLAIGQKARFVVDAHPGRNFVGEVVQIRKAPQVVQNVVTYVVVVSTENSDQALLPGMTANLQILVAQKQNVLKVPNAALRFKPTDSQAADKLQQSSVWVGQKNRDDGGHAGVKGRVFVPGPDGPVPVPVVLGLNDGRFTEVIAGALKEGQHVILGTQVPASTPKPLLPPTL